MRPFGQTPPPPSASPPPRAWHAVLRALREVRGVTQEGWAARLSVSRKTVQRWESGERAPDPGAEAAILDYCRETGLLRAFDRGPLAGLTLTEDGLRDILGEARWRGSRAGASSNPSPGAPLPAPSAPAAPPPHPTNLPVHLTSFVGREREVAAVRRVQAGTRLLTVTGAGGCGKTRLALVVADELLWAYPHGVWFADLAPLTDPALLPPAVATALGLRLTGQAPPVEALAEALRARHLLLVLDNCEHLLPDCAVFVEALLRACPRLEVVATSRESLGIGGETVWRVPPLGLPGGEDGADAGSGDAVRLFVERARLQRPEFAPAGDEAAAVADICRRLDGMPLAIELAAARVSVLSVGQIAARLHDRFGFLTNGGRTALPRHRTLRAAMDWSHDLLAEPERALLRALSVFAGGFTLEAAESVAPAGAAGEAGDAPDPLDRLAPLVEKSLVVAEEHGGAVRYRLLDTVRQYAGALLAGAGEAAATRGRHAGWCLALAADAAGTTRGAREVAWLDRVEREHDNLRAALAWTLAAEPGPGSAARRQTGLALAGALPRFWELRGHLSEGRRWLERALAAADESTAAGASRALALTGAGVLAYAQGDYPAAQTRFERSLADYRAAGDRRGVAAARGNLARTAIRRGDYAFARACLDAALADCRETGDRPTLANVEFAGGLLALRLGDYAAARSRFETSLALNRELGNREGVANALEELATVYDEEGGGEAPAALLIESLALYRELGDRSGVASVLGHLGMEAWARREPDRALARLREGLALYRAVGDRRGVARLLGNQALVVHFAGDAEAAQALCRESLALHLAAGDTWSIGRYLPILAGVAVRRGEPERAARLFAAASAIRAALGASLPPILAGAHDRAVAALRASLGETAFAAARAAGEAMTAEEAVEA